MIAAVYYGPKDVKIEEVPVPKIMDDEILIKMLRIGICPTDVRYYSGLRGESTFDTPHFTTGKDSFGLSGHEVVGQVMKVGKNVTDFKDGDIVTHETFTYCGECKYCRAGLINLCEKKLDIARGYAGYVRLPAKFAYKLDSDVGIKRAAFAEPLAVVIHAVRKIPQNNLAIIGAGPMGLLMALYARHIGKKIVLLEQKEERIKFAKGIGLDQVFKTSGEEFEKAKIILNNDIFGVISSVGGKNAIQLAYDLSSGPVVIFGGTYPPESIQLELNNIHYSEKIVTGSADHVVKDMIESIQLISNGTLPLESLVTREYHITGLKQAFDNIIAGNEMKVQIYF
ncbi:MAG: alcohol dehydrogenase catalytic domain-containing protein [Thermoplasmatales archaeon]|nr:alcohol dehydrogenase catalytic domain-containing protein [Thermoplasmatales archaeon]